MSNTLVERAGWWWSFRFSSNSSKVMVRGPKLGQPRHNAPGLTTHLYLVRAEQPAGT